MTDSYWEPCPNDCGGFRDTSGRYVHPANREFDQRWWEENHLSGKCTTSPVPSLAAAHHLRANPGTESSFSWEEIVIAAHRTADEIEEVADDDRLHSIVELFMYASLHFLEHPKDSLEAAIASAYGDDISTVLGWIGGEF